MIRAKATSSAPISARIVQLINNYPNAVIMGVLIALKLLVLLVNINNFPYVENDEATYTLRAMSFSSSGRLDYYTYWYDHAPAAWIFMSPFIALNMLLGSPLSQILLLRILMVLLASLSIGLTYFIGLKLFKRTLPAFLATLLLVVTPLGAYYQRRILLDNVMTFFVLVAVFLIIYKPRKLYTYALSGLVFGIAILSKLNAAFLAPAMILLIWQQQPHRVIRRHAIAIWVFITGSIVSLWLLYAGLKSELLPYSAHPETGAFTRISLLDTLRFQSARGGEPKLPWDPNSNIYPNVIDWFNKDTLLIGLSSLAIIYGLLMLLKKESRKQVAFLLLALTGLVLFMLRGGIVFGFYILPVLPFVALLTGNFLSAILSWFHIRKIRAVTIGMVVSILCVVQATPIFSQWTKDETTNQLRAVRWVINNIPDKSAYIISDNYALPYLIQAGYKNVDYQFKVEYDPAINNIKYNKDWRNGAYIIVSHEVLKQIDEGTTPFIKAAFDHSSLVASFTENSSSFLDITGYESTNGDWAQIYKIKTDQGIYLQDSWQSYKDRFIRSYGQIVTKPNSSGTITSSTDQATTMQMAVAEDDRKTFDGVWQWTQDHMQKRSQDTLLSSGWGMVQGKEGLTDSNTTSRANVLTAQALLDAHTKWRNPTYLEAATKLITDIQKYETRIINGRTLLIPYVTEQTPTSYNINPSYSDPYAFTQFAQAIPSAADHWQKMATDYYWLIASLQSTSKVGLVPNWITVDSQTGSIQNAAASIGASGNTYGFEAFHIPQILAKTYLIGNDARALQPLSIFNATYTAMLDKNSKVAAVMDLSGEALVDYEDIASNVSILSTFRALYKSKISNLERSKLAGQYNTRTHTWGNDPDNIRTLQTVWQYYSTYHSRL